MRLVSVRKQQAQHPDQQADPCRCSGRRPDPERGDDAGNGATQYRVQDGDHCRGREQERPWSISDTERAGTVADDGEELRSRIGAAVVVVADGLGPLLQRMVSVRCCATTAAMLVSMRRTTVTQLSRRTVGSSVAASTSNVSGAPLEKPIATRPLDRVAMWIHSSPTAFHESAAKPVRAHITAAVSPLSPK